MYIVTGTKRSGTSMWMQLMVAAGIDVLGEAFPRDWKVNLEAANPEGFYESKFRRGVYYATNPDPETGAYLNPKQCEHHAIKIFVPGLVRTDYAFINKVIATVRPWRQYSGSLRRLYAIEAAQRQSFLAENGIPPAPQLQPELEWWSHNFMLVNDLVTREYPTFLVAYDTVLSEPEEIVPTVFKWLGKGDDQAALRQVKPELRTQKNKQKQKSDDLKPDYRELDDASIEVFDTYYDVIRQRKPLRQDLVDAMNETQARLFPLIQADQQRVVAAAQKRQDMIVQRNKAAKVGVANFEEQPQI